MSVICEQVRFAPAAILQLFHMRSIVIVHLKATFTLPYQGPQCRRNRAVICTIPSDYNDTTYK